MSPWEIIGWLVLWLVLTAIPVGIGYLLGRALGQAELGEGLDALAEATLRITPRWVLATWGWLLTGTERAWDAIRWPIDRVVRR